MSHFRHGAWVTPGDIRAHALAARVDTIALCLEAGAAAVRREMDRRYLVNCLCGAIECRLAAALADEAASLERKAAEIRALVLHPEHDHQRTMPNTRRPT